MLRATGVPGSVRPASDGPMTDVQIFPRRTGRVDERSKAAPDGARARNPGRTGAVGDSTARGVLSRRRVLPRAPGPVTRVGLPPVRPRPSRAHRAWSRSADRFDAPLSVRGFVVLARSRQVRRLPGGSGRRPVHRLPGPRPAGSVVEVPTRSLVRVVRSTGRRDSLTVRDLPVSRRHSACRSTSVSASQSQSQSASPWRPQSGSRSWWRSASPTTPRRSPRGSPR